VRATEPALFSASFGLPYEAYNSGTVTDDAAFSPDGRVLLTIEKHRRAYLWDLTKIERTGLSGDRWLSEEDLAKQIDTGQDELQAVTFEAAGNFCVTAGRGVKVWACRSAQQIAAFDEGQDVRRVVFSRDGTRLAYVDRQGTLSVRHVPDWNLLLRTKSLSLESSSTDSHDLDARARDLSFSGDGRRVLVSTNTRVQAWEVDSRAKSLDTAGYFLSPPATMRDGKLVALRLSAEGYLHNELPPGEIVELVRPQPRRLHFPQAPAYRATWCGDGGLIVTATAEPAQNSGPDVVRVWPAAATVPIAEFRGHFAKIIAMACSADVRWVATADITGRVMLWDLRTDLLSSDRSRTGWRAMVLRDGRYAVTTSQEGDMEILDLSGRSAPKMARASSRLVDARATPDGRWFATLDTGGTVSVWDPASAQIRLTFAAHQGASCPDRKHPHVSVPWKDTPPNDWNWANVFALRRDGQQALLRSSDNECRVWNTGAGKDWRSVKPDDVSGRCGNGKTISFSPAGAVLVVNQEGVDDWPSVSQEKRGLLPIEKNPVFSPEGTRYIVSGSGVRVYDIEPRNYSWGTHGVPSWRAIYGLPELREFTFSTFRGDGKRVLSGDSLGHVVIWEPGTRATLMPVRRLHSAKVSSGAFSRSGQCGVTASDDGTAAVWLAGTGALIRTIHHHGPVVHAAFVPGSDAVVSATRNELYLTDTPECGKPDTLRDKADHLVEILTPPTDRQTILDEIRNGMVQARPPFAK
jgi:WD40 repeat protein